tara:strand:+ start:3523 stop:3900 length:378 start_codon:yes stop_codon:yes gene_type:complete
VHGNKFLKHLYLALVLSLYCFALGVVTGAFSNGTQFTHQSSDHDSFSTSESVNLFSASSRILSFSSIINDIGVPDANDYVGAIWIVFKNIENTFLSSYKQYAVYETNLLVQSRKSDLLYPFHFFW